MQLFRLDPDNSAYQFGLFASSKVIRRIDPPSTNRATRPQNGQKGGDSEDWYVGMKMIDAQKANQIISQRRRSVAFEITSYLSAFLVA